MATFVFDTSEVICSDPLDKGTWETNQDVETGVVTIKVRYCSGNPDNKLYCENKGLELCIAQYGI